MKKILYVTNITAPYRLEFFNQLSEKVDLTVIFEKSSSSNRNVDWFRNNTFNYKYVFLDGISISTENSFSFKLFKYLFSKKYDDIIFGCYNSPIQAFAICVLRFLKKSYCLSFDGTQFLSDPGIKSCIKRFVITGAKFYFVAGKVSESELSCFVNRQKIIPYYFSSLTKRKIEENNKTTHIRDQKLVLIVGQYLDVKGLDLAVEVAKMMPEFRFRFIGTGQKMNDFINDNQVESIRNIDVISFLDYSSLCDEYKKCTCLLIPSRRECWGLIVNEAASFGTPIVSTYGCGAAIEFLENDYSQLLAKEDSAEGLYEALKNLLKMPPEDVEQYSSYLMELSKEYNIEKSVEIFYNAMMQER